MVTAPPEMMGETEASVITPFPQNSWVPFVQGGNPNALGIVDPERAFSLTNEEIINQIQEAESESDRARKGLEDNWGVWEDLYHLRFSSPDKADWQADIIVPEVYHKIQTIKSLMQGALLDPEKFFVLVKETEIFPREQIRFIERWIQLSQKNAGLLPALLACWEEAFLLGTGFLKVSIEDTIKSRPGVEMEQIYSDPEQAFAAAQMGMPTQRPVVGTQDEVHSRIKCEKVHARHMYPDPYARNFYEGRYVIETAYVDEEEIEEKVRLGIYDSMDDIGRPEVESAPFDRFARFELDDVGSANRRRHRIQEYTGNLYDRDGKIACRNWVVTVINGRAIARIGPNPIWSGKTRYICSTPIPYEGRVWGRSLIHADAAVEVEMKNLLDLMLDDTKYAVLGAFQIDEDQVTEPEPITGIEPGRTYHGRGEFIKKLMFPSQSNSAWPAINYLQGIGDKSTQVNEFAAGTPSSRGRPTATEVQSKTQSSTGHINNIARRLEENDVERALCLIYEYLLQFGNELDPEVESLAAEWGGSQALLDPVQRFQILDVPFSIQVRGISMVANRESLWQRLMQLQELLMQTGLQPKDPLQLPYTIITSMGFSPEQIGFSSSPEEHMMWMQQQAALQQQQQQGGRQQQGGAPGAPGGGGTPAPGFAPTPTGAPSASDLMEKARANVPVV